MWVEIICGLVIFKLVKRFFIDDEVADVETADSKALFSVGTRLEKLYGGKAYVGLRIPDANSSSREDIDIVLVTKGEVVVISVKNLSGIVTVLGDGSWRCEGDGRKKAETHPDPLIDIKKRVSVLESYLEQRGIGLPEGHLSYKIVIPNPQFRSVHAFPDEVITYDEWAQLKPVSRSMFSGWVKGAMRGKKKELPETLHQKLNFILSTAPMWDRLELKNDKFILGEFLEFKGKQEDIVALRKIKRSKVGQLAVQKFSMFGLAPSKLQVLYSFRDYRNEGASALEWAEVTVRSSTEIIFQPQNAAKFRKFKLSSIITMSLSA